jgi:hypothetical protein
LQNAGQLTPDLVNRRVSQTEVRNYAQLFPYTAPGSLIDRSGVEPYQSYWNGADASTF